MGRSSLRAMTEACKAVLVAGVPARFGQSVWDAVGTVTAGRRKGLFYDEQASKAELLLFSERCALMGRQRMAKPNTAFNKESSQADSGS